MVLHKYNKTQAYKAVSRVRRDHPSLVWPHKRKTWPLIFAEKSQAAGKRQGACCGKLLAISLRLSCALHSRFERAGIVRREGECVEIAILPGASTLSW